ncbi:MAG: C4-dicarboxylate ABC transporter permease, partial [Rhodobacterales bacterium]
STVKNPFSGSKIPMRDVFSIYAVFMIAVGARYAWMIINIFRQGPPKTELEITLEEQSLKKKDLL